MSLVGGWPYHGRFSADRVLHGRIRNWDKQKNTEDKALEGRKDMAEAVYVCDVCARVRAKETHIEASPHTS